MTAAAVLIASCGGGAAEDFEAVLDPGISGLALGADRDCMVITSTSDEPMTIDRVAFEPTTAYTDAQEWTDVSVDVDGERFCVDVCACAGGGVVGHFVVEEGDVRHTYDVHWEAERCCESPVFGADGGF